MNLDDDVAETKNITSQKSKRKIVDTEPQYIFLARTYITDHFQGLLQPFH
jgi:hypothetical protein